ncbi:MAG: DUF1475 domain-containing protein [Asgard group archaeon]|nr:DUF1475 domain-containing protein [Asgard group archaeon]
MKNIGMLIAKIISGLGIIGIGFGLLYGFIWGDFIEEGKILLSIPWGVFTLFDIYVSFIVFCCWIIYREKSALWSSIWTLLVLGLGSLAICIYIFIALLRSKNDWQLFWHWKRIKQAPQNNKE